jgi:transaldolase
MPGNPLLELTEQGQSYWLDNLTRKALRSGELARRVRDEGLRGVTSNPKTFHDSVKGEPLYTEEIGLLARQGLSTQEIYERLSVADVRDACDILRPAFDSTAGVDGYVSLEISARLAHDTDGSIEEARRLAAQVARPNLMIKIPGTRAGIPAVEQLLYEGTNVNVTLLFSVERYAEFAQAYLRALDRRRAERKSVDHVRSVASFFLSRIDVLVDQLLSHRAHVKKLPQGAPAPDTLLGKVAVANAKLAYRYFLGLREGARWVELAKAKAQPQRLLWASTGTKNPSYRDVMYVEPLIGPDTVSTMPEETIAAVADHGRVAPNLAHGEEDAQDVMQSLEALGIDFDCVAWQLENDGIQKFIEPEKKTLELLDAERQKAQAGASQ